MTVMNPIQKINHYSTQNITDHSWAARREVVQI
jgi:hypothetical protein